MNKGSLLHLTGVETRKLLTGKTFFIATLLFLISITSTFISLSFTSGFVESMTAQAVDVLPDNETVQELIESVQSVLRQYATADLEFSFVQSMYATSSGTYLVVMIFSMVHIISDFSCGTARNPLICGYSRRQYYLAKLLSNSLAGFLFMTVSMIVSTIVGVIFYQTELTFSLLSIYVLVLLAQCVVVIEHTAIYTAMAFLFRNGWSVVASVLALSLPSGIALVKALLEGADHSFALSILPGFVSVNGVSQFYTLDQMAALPQLWTPQFLLAALSAAILLTGAFTVLGVRSFSRKNL